MNARTPHSITLTPFSADCVERTYGWVSDPELRRAFLMRGEVTPEGHRDYFRRVLMDPSQRVYAVLADGRHVGNCGLKEIDRRERRAELWIYLGDVPVRGKGIGTRATELLIEEARTALALKKLSLHVADFNEPARRLYAGLGFAEAAFLDTAGDWSGRDCAVLRMERTLSTRDVAMMQPSFLPWQGFFELLWMSDSFILLDDFQFSVQSYHQRNRIFINRGQPDWITAPVLKTVSFGAPLNEAKLNDATGWREKTWKRIQHNYGKAPFFTALGPRVGQWLLSPATSLAEQNTAFIMLVCDLLDIRREIRRSSDRPSQTQRSNRVAELLRSVHAERYFCARGSFAYMHEDGVFPLSGVETLFQDFRTRPYPQAGSPDTFVPSLSVLDALLNVGPERTLDLIIGGTNRWTTWNEMAAAPAHEEAHEH